MGQDGILRADCQSAPVRKLRTFQPLEMFPKRNVVSGHCPVCEYCKNSPPRARQLQFPEICRVQLGDNFFRSFNILFGSPDRPVDSDPRLPQSAVAGFPSLRVSLPQFANNGRTLLTKTRHSRTIVRAPDVISG